MIERDEHGHLFLSDKNILSFSENMIVEFEIWTCLCSADKSVLSFFHTRKQLCFFLCLEFSSVQMLSEYPNK